MKEHENDSKVKFVDFKTFNDKIPLRVYSILDTKVGEFFPPFTAKDDSDAIRQFSNLVNYSNSLISRFSEDYELYYLSDFYNDIGHFSISESSLIVKGNSLKRKDCIIYDNLLKEVVEQKIYVEGLIDDYKKMTETKSPTESINKKGPELYAPVSVSKSKKSILDLLFKK